MSKEFLKKITPEKIKQILRAKEHEKLKMEVARLPKINEKGLANILKDELGICTGDTLLIHSSIDRLNLSFPFFGMIHLLKGILGSEGTFLLPTYPKLTSYKFLKSGEVFNVKKTPSYTGALNEFVRRQAGSIRSLHPTKSVAGLGKNIKEITSTHHLSPYPYDKTSPYYKVSEFNGKIIGIGVDSTYLSAVHCADDILKDEFPVFPFHSEIFQAKCIDHNNNEIIVKTYAHDMKKMHFNLPEFFKQHIDNDICRDIDIQGMKFFIADSKPFISRMIQLAEEEKITIYKKKFYK
jgi:aminoglycoside 3-N-acetyltransferase